MWQDEEIRVLRMRASFPVTYYATPQERVIGDALHKFGIVIDANGMPVEQIYEFAPQNLLLAFGGLVTTVGSENPQGGGTGVYIDNFHSADINRLSFCDNSGTIRRFPFTAVINLLLTREDFF